jgi:menaquinone-dependent protoporphyrinogen oxidase
MAGTRSGVEPVALNRRRILVLYATREGQTAKVAKRIAERLAALGADVERIPAADRDGVRGLDLSSFDLLVFGASMHAGGLEPELVDYINEHDAEIAGKSTSFFLVLLSAATKDPELRSAWLADARHKMDEQLRIEFSDTEMIAGALAYSKYGPLLKWAMRRIAKQAGEATDTSRDYEYTDWEQVDRYAERLAGAG